MTVTKTVHGTNVIPAQSLCPRRRVRGPRSTCSFETITKHHNPEVPMGSLFSTPKPATVSAPMTRQQPATTEAETSAEDAARTARTEALERRRYGRASLIGTSHRGLLSDRIAKAGGGKNLLGE
jgi:hypothetical protein